MTMEVTQLCIEPHHSRSSFHGTKDPVNPLALEQAVHSGRVATTQVATAETALLCKSPLLGRLRRYELFGEECRRP
jgi:hypothetical protein